MTTKTRLPMFDLGRAAARVEAEVDQRWRRLRGATAFVGGEEVSAFESAWAGYLGAAGCVGVGNGTDALEIALRALGIQLGDEVLLPAYTFIATASAVAQVGGVPVFCDVEPHTLNLDLEDARRRITPRTAGMIGVHLYGRPFAVTAASDLCRDAGLWLIEDAAQAHGAAVCDVKVGAFGDLATWSFYPAKNLGCFGDGGAVTGPKTALLDDVRRLANHGRVGHYRHADIGRNSRLDAVQAAVLNARLPLLDADNARRREIACRYHEGLDGVAGVRFLEDAEGLTSVYHQMTVRVERRDELQAHLDAEGIGTSVHYPMALHRQPAFEGLAGGVSLPVSEAAGDDVLCLPMFPELTDDEVDRVVAAVRRFY